MFLISLRRCPIKKTAIVFQKYRLCYVAEIFHLSSQVTILSELERGLDSVEDYIICFHNCPDHSFTSFRICGSRYLLKEVLICKSSRISVDNLLSVSSDKKTTCAFHFALSMFHAAKKHFLYVQ